MPEEIKVGDVFVTDAGEGNRFVEIITKVEPFAVRCVKMQFGNDGDLFSLQPSEFFNPTHWQELGWKTGKYTPPEGFVLSTGAQVQELADAF